MDFLIFKKNILDITNVFTAKCKPSYILFIVIIWTIAVIVVLAKFMYLLILHLAIPLSGG